MKKRTFLLASVIATLSLSGCNNGNQSNSISSVQSQSQSQPEEPVVGGLTDYVPANTELSFKELETNVMVDNEIKTYIDAMEEQETTLEKPFHITPLYGPSDYARMAKKDASTSYGNYGKTYPSNETGGVDACQYLPKNSKDINVPIVVKWDANGETYEEAKVKFWSTEDFSDIRETAVSVDENGVASASLANLFKATKYRVQVIDGDKVSQGFEFDTADYPRIITMGDSSKRVNNVRDIGGYMTSYGVRTNQGLMYRGYYIDDKSGGHGINYNDAVGQVHEEVMKIGYEIDLQSKSETNGRTESCLVGASYECLTLVSYQDFLAEKSYTNLPKVFSILANANNKHVYFHCYGGADRTGMLAFFINAICGVSYTDLIEDFEITSETNNIRCHMHNSTYQTFVKFLDEFTNNWVDYDEDLTVNENCENWLKDVAGVDAEDIEKIRTIMIPGYEDGLEPNIPVYTPSANMEEDDVGQWYPAVEDNKVRCNYQRKDELDNGSN